MRIAKPYLLSLISLAVIIILSGCDTDLPITTDNGTASLAPARPYQKVYVVEETKEYHLFHCSQLTGDNVVMVASEAEAEGYAACESCFPPPPVPHVHVIESDSVYYHHRGCRIVGSQEKKAIPKTQAIEEGYEPCPVCVLHYVPPRPEPHVHIIESDNVYYHHRGCRIVGSQEKKVVLKTQALEDGYLPCPACTIVYRLRGAGNRIVFITEHGQEESRVYHTDGTCHYLDEGWENGTLTIVKLWEAEKEGYRESEGTCPDDDSEE